MLCQCDIETFLGIKFILERLNLFRFMSEMWYSAPIVCCEIQ